MNGNHLDRMGTKRMLLALAATGAAMLAAGCSNMVSTAPTATALTSGGQLSGNIHGGSQPVAGATVTLYYAGQSGFGSGDPSGGASGAAVVAAVTTSADDGHGSFSFTKDTTNGDTTSGNTFSCPTAGDPLVYVVARGGNTLNTHDSSVNNSSSAFLAVFDLCSRINASSFVAMNEVTTVASMVALQQYFNPVTESIGADGIGVSKTAITNTVQTISNLANMSTGTAVTSKTVSGGLDMTVTAQTTKINALANIIAACVNNASSSATACSTLFANATPPDVNLTPRPAYSAPYTQATDVLQALYYMLTNPTNGSTANLQNLYNLIPAVGSAFQPTLVSPPSDWTVALTYSTTATCGSGGGGFINKPEEINIDQYGDIVISNGQANSGNLSVMTAGGSAFSCTSLGGGARSGGTVDAKGNLWYPSRNANTITRYSFFNGTSLTYTTSSAPLAIFADGGNGDQNSNIYFTTDADTSLYMIPQAAQATSATTPVQISSVVGSNPAHLMVDLNRVIWVTSGDGFISRVATGSLSDPNYLNGYTTTQFSVPSSTAGIAVNTNGVYVSSTGANTVSLLTGSGTSYSLAKGSPLTSGLGGLSNPVSVALDGRSNLWAVNADSTAVTEISADGAAMFPNGLQLDSNYISVPHSVLIDQSGNVWIANEGPAGSPANFITEIVGAAVPMYQPFSLGLYNGRFQTLP